MDDANIVREALTRQGTDRGYYMNEFDPGGPVTPYEKPCEEAALAALARLVAERDALRHRTITTAPGVRATPTQRKPNGTDWWWAS